MDNPDSNDFDWGGRSVQDKPDTKVYDSSRAYMDHVEANPQLFLGKDIPKIQFISNEISEDAPGIKISSSLQIKEVGESARRDATPSGSGIGSGKSSMKDWEMVNVENAKDEQRLKKIEDKDQKLKESKEKDESSKYEYEGFDEGGLTYRRKYFENDSDWESLISASDSESENEISSNHSLENHGSFSSLNGEYWSDTADRCSEFKSMGIFVDSSSDEEDENDEPDEPCPTSELEPKKSSKYRVTGYLQHWNENETLKSNAAKKKASEDENEMSDKQDSSVKTLSEGKTEIPYDIHPYAVDKKLPMVQQSEDSQQQSQTQVHSSENLETETTSTESGKLQLVPLFNPANPYEPVQQSSTFTDTLNSTTLPKQTDKLQEPQSGISGNISKSCGSENPEECCSSTRNDRNAFIDGSIQLQESTLISFQEGRKKMVEVTQEWDSLLLEYEAKSNALQLSISETQEYKNKLSMIEQENEDNKLLIKSCLKEIENLKTEREKDRQFCKEFSNVQAELDVLSIRHKRLQIALGITKQKLRSANDREALKCRTMVEIKKGNFGLAFHNLAQELEEQHSEEIREGKKNAESITKLDMSSYLRFSYTSGDKDLQEEISKGFSSCNETMRNTIIQQCEISILKRLELENALEFYIAGEKMKSENIMACCSDFLQNYKKWIWPEQEDFIEFTKEHSELAYKLFID